MLRFLFKNDVELIKPYKRTETTRLFDKLNTAMYLGGFKNFWIENVNLPKKFTKIYDYLNIALHILSIVLSLLEVGSFLTQNNLTSKQRSDRYIIGISNPIIYLYGIKLYLKRRETREVFYYLGVVLKEAHNDRVVEENMLKKFNKYVKSYVLATIFGVGLNGLYSIVQVFTKGKPFVTVITLWPNVQDMSKSAGIARVLIYIFWWISLSRSSLAYFILLMMLIGLGHQYMNLQSYFYSLQTIFDDKTINQREKEEKYEKYFKVGVKMHADTIWCANQIQNICREIFASHVLLAVGMLLSILPGMINARQDMVTAFAYVPVVIMILLVKGFFMWNAGDIIVEASKLPQAIYASGWENCYSGSAVRVRKQVVFAIRQAQQPIVLTALGVVELSYETYLSIIKTAYSVFSVFY